MPEEQRPPGPFHLGGPKPILSPRGHARVALAIGEAALAMRPDKEVADAVTAMRRAVFEHTAATLLAGEALLPKRNLAASLHYAAHIAPGHRWKGEKGGLPLDALDAIVSAATREPGIDLRELLAAADEALLREELIETLAFRAPGAPRSIARVRWRVGPGDGASHWIATLADESWLLLYRTPRESGKRQSWICVCGEKPDVLAAVPDAWSQSAARAVG